MRQPILAVAALAAGLMAGAGAEAACAGRDLLPEFRQQDPAGIAGAFRRAHAIPNGRGLFWRVERAGLAPSHLFGTFHAPEAVDFVAPGVWRALDSADAAVFELSLDEQAALQRRAMTDPSFVVDRAAPPLTSALDARAKALLAEALAARGVPLQAAEQMRAWMLLTLLGFPACHLQAMASGAEPLDTVMAHRARDRGIAVAGLETYEQALASLSVFDRPTLVEALMATTGSPGVDEDFFRTMTELYAAREVTAINELSIWFGQRMAPHYDMRGLNERLMAEVLDRRNRAWMRPLMSHLRRGNAFVAVGALHLPGKAGLVELLRAQGYAVTRLD